MDLPDWWPWRCWVCEGKGDAADEALELKVPRARATEPEQAAGNSSARATSPRDQERVRLRELMKSFVYRGQQGVGCELVDAGSGALSRATYAIDERLESLSFSSSPSAEAAPTASHVVLFAQVTDVLRPDDRQGTEDQENGGGAFPRSLLDALSDEQHRRLVKVVWVGESRRELCFLEASPSDRQRFVTCVKILRRYMEEADSRP